MKTQHLPYYTVIFLAGLTLASLAGVNPYHFGQWNHYISLPWLKDLLNPALYPGDVLIAQRENSPTLYYYFLAALAPVFQYKLTLLFFVVYGLTLAATFYSIYSLTLALFKNQRAAWLALILLSFSFPVLGSVRIWESMLMERTLTLPWLLVSVVFMLRKRYVPAVLLQALAFNFHALSAIHLIVLSWVGMLAWQGWQWRYLRYAAFFIALISPVLYFKISASTGDSMVSFSQLWMNVMEARNGHHIFISEASGFIILKTLSLILAYFYLLKHHLRQHFAFRFFWGFGIAAVLMLAVGVIFTEVIPVRLIIQLQFMRSFVFFTLAFFILWAGAARYSRSPAVGVLGMIVAAQYFYGQWPKAIVALSVAGLAWYFLAQNPSKKILPGNRILFPKLNLLFIPLSIYILAAVAGWQQRGGIELNYWKNSNAYANVGAWLKNNTPPEAMLISPPQEAGMRLISERSCFGEWYDGTKAFFSESYAQHWQSRMQQLNTTNPLTLEKDYRSNNEKHFTALADSLYLHYNHLYVIQYADTPLNLPQVYNNTKYAVYHIPKKLALSH